MVKKPEYDYTNAPLWWKIAHLPELIWLIGTIVFLNFLETAILFLQRVFHGHKKGR